MAYRYAAIVKNLRGVIYSNMRVEDFLEKFSWLMKRFRYRTLGVPPSLLEKYPIPRELGTIVELIYPSSPLREILRKLSKASSIPFQVLEATALASTYVSPLIILGHESLELLKAIIVDTVYRARKLTLKEWKLHFRIVDYTTLDLYIWSLENALKILRNSIKEMDFSHELNERINRIREDKKRYWRVIAEEGEPFISYLDLLPLLVETKEIAEKVIGLDWGPAILGIVGSIIV